MTPPTKRGEALTYLTLVGLVAYAAIATDLYLPAIPAMIRDLGASENKALDDYLAMQLIKRVQTPEDIAYAMAYLHTSRAMTGQALNIDGGTFFH